MAIRLRHDAAALGSSLAGGGGSNRKYGQQLVMQQRKYDMDQMNAMQDRAFDMQKQQMQNAWQEDRDFKNDLLSRMRQEQEQDFRAKQAKEARDFAIGDRDRQRQQAGFDSRIDATTRMAQEALKRSDLPAAARQRLTELIGGALAIRGKAFDEPQVVEFSDPFYKGVSEALSQILPPKPLYEQENENLVHRLPGGGGYVDPAKYPEGTQFVVKDTRTGKEWITEGANQPKLSPSQAYYGENRKEFSSAVAAKEAELQDRIDSGEIPFFDSSEARKRAAMEMVMRDYDLQDSVLRQGGMPQASQPMAPGASPGVSSTPAARSVSPAVMQTVGDVLNTFPDTEMMAMSQLGREALVQNGFPQGQAQAPSQPPVTMPTDRAGMVAAGVPQGGAVAQQQAPSQPPVTMPTDRAGMVAAGMPQGGATATPVQQPPSQNPWEEFVSPPQQQASVQKTESAVAPSEATVSAPDFKKLSESATDSADKLVLGRLQSMYGSQPLDIQKAISAFVDPGSTEEIAGQAIMYLKNKGIDILQLGKPRKRKLPGMSQ